MAEEYIRKAIAFQIIIDNELGLTGNKNQLQGHFAKPEILKASD